MEDVSDFLRRWLKKDDDRAQPLHLLKRRECADGTTRYTRLDVTQPVAADEVDLFNLANGCRQTARR